MGGGGSTAVGGDSNSATALQHTTVELDWAHPTRKLENHYRKLSNTPIGRGHFADVYAGQDLESHKMVAIKAIYRKRTNEETLKTEIGTLLSVATHNNPGIVNLYDAFLTEDIVYIVLEYCAGGELFDHLVDLGPYEERRASELIKQLALALKFLHNKGVCHRDLKPENILLSSKREDAVVKIADFGLAKFKIHSFMTSVCGTWAYCAPEVKRDHVYTKKVDVWSLGVILYVMLGGYHPFDPDGCTTDKELEKNIQAGTFDFDDPVWEGISAEARDLMVRMICVDPATRISIDEVMQHPWITHQHSSRQALITNPEGIQKLVNKWRSRRMELGSVLHVKAVFHMKHLVDTHKTQLTEEHIDEVHATHEKHREGDPVDQSGEGGSDASVVAG